MADSLPVRPIKFGIFDWIDRNQLALPELYEQRLKLVDCADALGFYCYHIAEHHASPLNMTPSPNLFLAAATQRTQRIRLGTEEVRKHLDVTASNYFVSSFAFGGLTTEQAMNSLRLFAEEVIPAFSLMRTQVPHAVVDDRIILRRRLGDRSR